MPTQTSTNRYVPYRSAQYKGKTYIYMEGNEPDDYLRYISSSDLTSSSENEFEEIDMYMPLGPKYKTLIEVVLKPSTNNNVQDTYTDDVKNNSDKPSGIYSDIPSDIPINKWTEEEWNELKKDFISQYLQNIQKDLSNENKSGNTFMDSQPDTLQNNMEEKPFITSIQDRFLDNHEKINYYIDWNVPKHTQIYSNITHTPKDNSLYSGIDLINDYLSGKPIDIYDELLKRKENELFGTKYPKNTSTNRVVKETYSDPISNQIDLFHKWLDRHRSNQWKNKPDMSNEEWNRQHDDNIPVENDNNTTHKMLNTNLYVEISSDMTPRSNMDISGTNPIYSDTNRYTYFDDISIHEVSLFNNKDKLLNTNLYVEISSDMTPRSNMDISGTNRIYSDTNRYTYFDDISIDEVSLFNNRDKLLNTNLSIEISSDMTLRSNMDISGTNTIHSNTDRYTYFDDISIDEVSSFNNRDKLLNTKLYVKISSDMTLRSNMDISGTNTIYNDTNRYTYFDDISIDEVSPFNNRDKLFNTNLYVKISSDMTPRSNMDISGTNTIYNDTNRYTYFDDISIDEVSPFNNRDKLFNTNLYVKISSDMTPRSNMDISGTNTIYSDTNRYTYFDDMDSIENSSDENL
ncbi:erythrocyte membrane protein 1, PfEMP1, putative [Plasmodium gaboni]|uniref:Erythrocyte membrane protein 1, PfEMP1, putative n=1 Tax=Plasmodium gaboni TaxID=647221 RepID=A0ABY0KWE3_9APIC|nr:erythrocyte membrane protein 1, PfEMP1, putative [Plasmodium gaboni]